MSKVLFFPGGIHPKNDGKALSSSQCIKEAPLMENYYVLFTQHIGAPAKPIVKKGDKVLKGQLIAEPAGFISAPIHSPTSGTVKNIFKWISPTGITAPAALIESDGEDTPAEPMTPIENWQDTKPATLIKRIADAGIVGMGGAAFPTNIKLSPPAGKKIDILILNGAECEPYLTADHRSMLENPEKIIKGAKIIKHILGVKKVYIGIENNKPDAIKILKEKTTDDIIIQDLNVLYPQGAEKQLIYALTGRKVPAGGLPMEVGCVVQNIGTAVAIYEAIVEGKPLYERITTVTGTPLVNPGNWRFRIGTTLEEVLKLCGGVKENPGKIIFGGPMMGMAQLSLETPIMKNTSGILLLSTNEVNQFAAEPCISCAKCVDVCPMNLLPSALSNQVEKQMFDLCETWNVMDCMECGCCSFICPAKRPLVHYFKRAKSFIAAQRKNKR